MSGKPTVAHEVPVPHSDERGATYGEVFAVPEFRALFAAQLLSAIGDQLAKLAVALLVFDRTGSQFWSAVSFGVGYLPWVIAGPALAAFGDRHSARSVMVVCDLARALLVAAIALPGIPVWAVVALLFAAAMFAPAFSAARSASLPDILAGDRYVLGLSASKVAYQFAQVAGFLAGGVLVHWTSVKGAVLADAASFGLSAMLILRFMQPRPRRREASRTSLLRDSLDGLRLTFGNAVLTRYMLIAWIGAAFLTAPEGLMPSYARHLLGDEVVVGLLYAAIPFGSALGLVVYARLVPPAQRRRQIRPMALLSLLALAPAAFDPGLGPLLGLLALAGFGGAFQLGLNAAFVQALPVELRARAFGVAAGGLQVFQGMAIALCGALAERFDPPIVVGACGLTGALALLPAFLHWPDGRRSSP